jgi:signal transduction histidine kinase
LNSITAKSKSAATSGRAALSEFTCHSANHLQSEVQRKYAMPKANVLIVEDDVNLLEGIRDILELDEYAVLTAENGEEGLKVLHGQPSPPDLIVSDIMMPRMDGIQFYREVRKEERWVSIPFIFLTAKGEKADIQRGKRLGVDDYVVKPFDATDLLVAIESRLERTRVLNNFHAGELSDLKRKILTILNHEFRTPLTFVVAYADMLNSPSDERLGDAEMLTFLKGVSTGADRLRKLIENFILLVELDTGDARDLFEMRKETITHLDELIYAAIDRYQKTATDAANYQVQVDEGLPALVSEREFLTKAIIQLIDNAVKFSDGKNPNRQVTVGARLHEGEIYIWVKDEGRGISPDEQEKIWDSFYQINRAVNEDQGAGAGLAIVRGIAEMHGGRVDMDSQEGAGSTFYIILPAAS